MMIVLAILYILYATFNYLKSFISVNIAQKLCFNIRSDLIKQINKIDIKEIEKRKKGDITSIVVNDVEEVSDFFSNSVSELLYHAVVMVGIVFMMLYISIKLSIISFLTIPIIFIFLNINKKDEGLISFIFPLVGFYFLLWPCQLSFSEILNVFYCFFGFFRIQKVISTVEFKTILC